VSRLDVVESPTTEAVPMDSVVDFNPKPTRGSIPDDLAVSFVPMAAVEAGSGRLDPTQVRRYGEVKKGFTTFRDGDVLFAKITPCMENGKMAVARELRNGVGCGSTEFHVLRPRNAVDPRYLYYFVSSAVFRREAAQHMTGAVGQRRVPLSFLRESVLPLPAIDVQQRICAEIETQFSRLDEAVANLRRVKANLARYKGTVLRDAIEGRLIDSSARASWSVAPLASVANVQLGQQRAPVHADAVVQLPYIRAANVTWNGLDVTDVKTMGFPNPDRYRLQAGDVLLAEASGSAKEVGKPVLWNDEIPGACYQKTLIRVRADRKALTPQFVFYYFLHTCLSGAFAKLAPGVGILHLTAERMLDWPIVVPPLAEQHRIVAEVDRRLSIVRGVAAEVDANLKRAEALRRAVLAKAFGA
jgi:type I restriction enzyme S subunit